MAGVTSDGVYRPSVRLAVASSFEGIFNDGARECGLTSFNAYHSMPEGRGRFFNRAVQPSEFGSMEHSNEMQAFLRLRPWVETADDYMTVLDAIHEHPELVTTLLAHPDDEASYDPLIGWMNERRVVSEEPRGRFRDAFYAERKRMQRTNYDAWLGLQEPFADTVPEFRYLIRTQQRGVDDKLEAGFVPWFATSKDEVSTYGLCTFYAKLQKLDPADTSEDPSRTCMITRERIIGRETTTDKVEQLSLIALQEDMSYAQVWRLNDRYDPEQQTELWDNGFRYQFFLSDGGYAFPHDRRRAEEDPMVIVVPRQGLAKALGQKAQEWRF